MDKDAIDKYFYKKSETLFPDIVDIKKEQFAIEKSARLYQNRFFISRLIGFVRHGGTEAKFAKS